MSRGKFGVASANRRAGQAENDATHWRKRALDAEADARGFKRTAAMMLKRAEDRQVLLDQAVADRDAATCDEIAELKRKVEGRQQVENQRDLLARHLLLLFRRKGYADEVLPGEPALSEMAQAMGFKTGRDLVAKIQKMGGGMKGITDPGTSGRDHLSKQSTR